MAHVHDRTPYQLENGSCGTATILIADLPDGRKLVACADENEDDDAAVNMVVEHLHNEVWRRHSLTPAQVVWVEYTSETLNLGAGQLGGWELVTFDSPTGEPSWRQMTRDDWSRLGTAPPPDPIPQKRPHRRI